MKTAYHHPQKLVGIRGQHNASIIFEVSMWTRTGFSWPFWGKQKLLAGHRGSLSPRCLECWSRSKATRKRRHRFLWRRQFPMARGWDEAVCCVSWDFHHEYKTKTLRIECKTDGKNSEMDVHWCVYVCVFSSCLGENWKFLAMFDSCECNGGLLQHPSSDIVLWSWGRDRQWRDWCTRKCP